MADYKKMYAALFNKITEMIEDLEEIQQQTEEMYLEQDDTPLTLVRKSEEQSPSH